MFPTIKLLTTTRLDQNLMNEYQAQVPNLAIMFHAISKPFNRVSLSSQKHLFLASLIFISFLESKTDSDFVQKSTEPLSIELYHKIGESQTDFSYRGKILVKPPSEFRPASASLLQQDLKDSELEALIKATQADDLYYLQAKLIAKNQTSTTVSKSCSLLASNLRDHITVNLNEKNEFININFHARNPICNEHLHSPAHSKLETSVQVQSTSIGPVPDTATHIRRLEEERKSKLHQDKADNRSFFAKYWMYIVPGLFLLMVLGGPGEAGGR